MNKNEAIELVDSLTVGQSFENRFGGLSTREVVMVKENRYEINNFISGWTTANVNKDQLIELLIGEMKLTELNWK